MLAEQAKLPPIEMDLEVLTPEIISAFGKATDSKHFRSIPPSFATRFRKAEFQWLDRMKVDMRTLLHIEQEYEYVSPLIVGKQVSVSSRISEWKERRAMTFVTIQTSVSQEKEVKIKSNTTFLLQNVGEKA